MSVRILGVLAVSAMALAACGDDTGGAGGSGGGAGGTDPSTTSSTGGEGGSTTTTTTTTGGGGEGGEGTTTTGAGGEGGGGEAPPCADECEGDAGCDATPPDPADACGTCVQAEATAQSECALTGALGPCCSENEDCSAYVQCVLGGSTQEECATDNPDGGARASACVLAACGNCGSPE